MAVPCPHTKGPQVRGGGSEEVLPPPRSPSYVTRNKVGQLRLLTLQGSNMWCRVYMCCTVLAVMLARRGPLHIPREANTDHQCEEMRGVNIIVLLANAYFMTSVC